MKKRLNALLASALMMSGGMGDPNIDFGSFAFDNPLTVGGIKDSSHGVRMSKKEWKHRKRRLTLTKASRKNNR